MDWPTDSQTNTAIHRAAVAKNSLLWKQLVDQIVAQLSPQG